MVNNPLTKYNVSARKQSKVKIIQIQEFAIIKIGDSFQLQVKF